MELWAFKNGIWRKPFLRKWLFKILQFKKKYKIEYFRKFLSLNSAFFGMNEMGYWVAVSACSHQTIFLRGKIVPFVAANNIKSDGSDYAIFLCNFHAIKNRPLPCPSMLQQKSGSVLFWNMVCVCKVWVCGCVCTCARTSDDIWCRNKYLSDFWVARHRKLCPLLCLWRKRQRSGIKMKSPEHWNQVLKNFAIKSGNVNWQKNHAIWIQFYHAVWGWFFRAIWEQFFRAVWGWFFRKENRIVWPSTKACFTLELRVASYVSIATPSYASSRNAAIKFSHCSYS